MDSTIRTLAFCLFAAVVMVACGDNLVPRVEPDAPIVVANCGDRVVEGDEDCDDGDTLPGNVCDETCHFTCGNQRVDTDQGELCDTGIASGTGSCPSSCDDGMDCTQDVLTGAECLAECVHASITTPANGDGCCPTGANASNDDDCDAVCGNGVREPGEMCDTGIATGTGSCPTACDDNMSCTTDLLVDGSTCDARCTATEITQTIPNDGCCPPGANSTTDNDCVVGCGNGVVDAGETCDTAIAQGPGRCPTSCTDGMVCTRDVLNNGGTCTAACTFPAITQPMSGDGCCPATGNNNNDSDCPPDCGNMIVEQGEQCDDGNTNDTDACNNNCQLNTVTGTAFRMRDLDVRDPHVYVDALGCRDVTDTQFFGFAVNSELQTSIQTDGDSPADNILDLSIATVFRPLDQSLATNAIEIHFPSCSTPLASTVCSRNPPASPPITATATNTTAGTCLMPLSGTLTAMYTPEVANATGPCYVSNAVTVTVNIAGIPITLQQARIAATYVGTPATNTVNGLLMGFISEADANATILPSSLPVIGGDPLSSVLPGGNGNCASHDDRDMNGNVRGWWFYLNFTAPRVTWIDN